MHAYLKCMHLRTIGLSIYIGRLIVRKEINWTYGKTFGEAGQTGNKTFKSELLNT